MSVDQREVQGSEDGKHGQDGGENYGYSDGELSSFGLLARSKLI